MSWTGLQTNETITFDDLNDAVANSIFVYKPGAVTSGSEALTRTEVEATIYCSIANTILANELVVKADLAAVSEESIIPLDRFDFMVVRYYWATGAGTDLDIMVGFEHNGNSTLDGDYVGYGQGNATVPASSPTNNSYLSWASDNTGVGYESVLIGMEKYVSDFASPDIIEVALYAVWYGSLGTGDFSVELTSYLGGTMSVNSFNFVNTGGSVVESNTLNLYTDRNNQNSNVAAAARVAVVRFNRATQKGEIVIS